MLCYIPGLGWIAAVLFLALDPYRTNRYIRFHAYQGLYLAVIWLLAHVIFFPFPGRHGHFPFDGLRGLMELGVVVAQVIGIVKTLRHEQYRLPVLGELADKSMA